MEIQSAFNSGVQGFQNATDKASQAATDIAASTAVNTEQKSTVDPEQNSLNLEVSSEVVTNKSLPDLNQSIVDLKVAEYQAKSSAEVIKSADESLGTLLDVVA